ncbi:hypothetical protein SNE40_018154 [Patella caerulea]|uniref:Integrase catalytic domain-containing protein n=1 Tax=Patella caerulea TaxID=87958 RepID=A0AAN8PGN0_PATCE
MKYQLDVGRNLEVIFSSLTRKITVDYYSDYFEIDRLHDKRAPEIIKKLKLYMTRHGVPNEVITENGPPFNSESFRIFSNNYDFKHVTSSPRYPQSNGKVESAVKTAKRLLTKSLHSETNPHLAVLYWRTTPTECIGSSPAQRLFGRRTRTLLPTTNRLLGPQIVRNLPEKIAERKQKQAFYYNRNAAKLSKLKEGDVVRIKSTFNDKRWWKAVVNQEAGIRSYHLTTESGRSLRRNRRHQTLSREKPPDLMYNHLICQNKIKRSLSLSTLSYQIVSNVLPPVPTQVCHPRDLYL